jgi:hypothetical protein
MEDNDHWIKKNWHGRDRTIANICDIFKLSEGSNERVKRVLDYVVVYEAWGEVYRCEY